MKGRCTIAALLVLACVANGEVKLASVFSDHMVLQRDKAVAVWGTADPGKSVTVTIDGHSTSDKADKSGNWIVRLNKHQASQTPLTMTVSEDGGNTISISDILFGDVWICSGQSNMGFQLFETGDKQAIASSKDEQLRLMRVPRAVSDTPLQQQNGKWSICSPKTSWDFTAVGYYFGKELRAREHVPVGLIGTYWGGTAAEPWTPAKYLQGEQWKPMHERAQAMLEAYPKKHHQWEERVKNLSPGAKKPPEPEGKNNPHQPSVLWNGMVNPLVPMTIKGVIWYQGESNAQRAEQYRTLFPLLIKAWRQEFDEGNFPFLFVQIAAFGKSGGDTDRGSEWAELREAQTMTLKSPNTGMAVTIDIGSPTRIHPKDKATVGKRLALVAEKVAYGHKLEDSGPMYKSMKVDGDKIKITFTHAKGLTAKGGAVKGFTIAGRDEKFVPAQAKIDGDHVIVFSDKVQNPVAVRYAWAEDPEVTLYNSAGLPAVPFRTDNWPEVTAGKE
ncbi:MAG TPA: sialate O-acetylesterase [Tepidisphaeraceae bacterium]|nr:sialate O-acetylesterase [Tepidisphaeraceae bacterium]